MIPLKFKSNAVSKMASVMNTNAKPNIHEDNLNKGVWGLAVTVLFSAMATVMVCSILPLFLCETLKASKTSLGLIEGTAVFIAFATKCLSGVLSDYFKKRKGLIVLGVALGVVAKSLFAISGNIFMATSARFVDRCSKGFRAAPIDALVADLTNNRNRGTGYGVRYSMAALGMILGYLSSSLILKLNPGNYSLVFTLAVIPSLIALFLSIIVVVDAKISPNNQDTYASGYFVRNLSSDLKKSKLNKIVWAKIKLLPKSFWQLMFVVFALMLARFSEGFLTLYAKGFNWEVSYLPLLMIVYELSNAAISILVGRISDRFNNYYLLLIGIILLACKNLATIFNNSEVFIVIMFAFSGIHMGIYQSVIARLLSQKASVDMRGTVFSMYYFVCGVAVLFANYIAGFLSDNFGIAGAFYGGLLFTTVSALTLLLFINKLSPTKTSSNNLL